MRKDDWSVGAEGGDEREEVGRDWRATEEEWEVEEGVRESEPKATAEVTRIGKEPKGIGAEGDGGDEVMGEGWSRRRQLEWGVSER
jgi:hypothetical protein